MKTYISIDKRSKKAQKEYYSSQRNSWGNLNPATRTMPTGRPTIGKRKQQNSEKRWPPASLTGDRISLRFCYSAK